ncbi:MAG: (d)CMP kinase [Hyphomicrobiales bacterium]|nr:(d)CMP kinase [Hyphomicrobiales bacterium]
MNDRSQATSDSAFVIAIDGPAASGKGTLSRRLAEEFGYAHLDTGLTYRAVGHALLQNDLPLDNEAVAVEIAKTIDLSKLDRAVLSDHAIGEAASIVAVMGSVRRALVDAQRKFSKTLPGTILDGRDIGTVVCPDANIKFYVVASPGVRAGRRFEEIVNNGGTAIYDDILRDIRTRDERDMGRKDSPLKPAGDAHLIDTSKMDIETAFQTAKAIVKKTLAV